MSKGERRVRLAAALAIFWAGLDAGWAIYKENWNLFIVLVIVGFWAGGCIYQVQITAGFRKLYEHYFAQYNLYRTRYDTAVQWNRYMWAELTAIGGRANGYTLVESYFSDPPGPEAGEVIPPEGSAGGS